MCHQVGNYLERGLLSSKTASYAREDTNELESYEDKLWRKVNEYLLKCKNENWGFGFYTTLTKTFDLSTSQSSMTRYLYVIIGLASCFIATLLFIDPTLQFETPTSEALTNVKKVALELPANLKDKELKEIPAALFLGLITTLIMLLFIWLAERISHSQKVD